jgi:hypothetical protein
MNAITQVRSALLSIGAFLLICRNSWTDWKKKRRGRAAEAREFGILCEGKEALCQASVRLSPGIRREAERDWYPLGGAGATA